ncbi:hypothetical protein KC669_03435, partial [Candidatus Dojkabacteria bacterium]|nr:hypothetical protein [Candidatus Dojkabacteria bacterium]
MKQNSELFERYFIKEYTIKAVRKFFENKNYHELESPILTDSLPQERYLDALYTDITLQNGESKRAYLIPSTETWNKKILVAGLGNHFVITKVFRGLEEIGPNHSPEFTMLEWYQVGDNYFDLMDTTEELVRYIITFINEKSERPHPVPINRNHPLLKGEGYKLNYQGQEIDFGTKWDRFSVRELLRKHVNIELEEIELVENFRKIAIEKGFEITDQDDWQTIFEIIFSSAVEPNFAKDKPTFVYDFPRILCPLTKVKESDPLVSEKTEFYIAGKEIGNGYTELTDWEEQKRRFDEEQAEREKLGKE